MDYVDKLTARVTRILSFIASSIQLWYTSFRLPYIRKYQFGAFRLPSPNKIGITRYSFDDVKNGIDQIGTHCITTVNRIHCLRFKIKKNGLRKRISHHIICLVIENEKALNDLIKSFCYILRIKIINIRDHWEICLSACLSKKAAHFPTVRRRLCGNHGRLGDVWHWLHWLGRHVSWEIRRMIDCCLWVVVLMWRRSCSRCISRWCCLVGNCR